jgi:hypothetical protein
LLGCCDSRGESPLRGPEREEARRSISLHFALFQDLMTLARGALQSRQYSSAAVYAQLAAHYAWFNHAGIFASAQLEQILRSIGLKTLGASRFSRASPSANVAPARVLHVLTEAYPVGGHTRLVWRWIRLDAERSHSVVLTNQGDLQVPRPLQDVTRMSGGRLYLLDRRTHDLVSRARVLRGIAESVDQVVLHIHPYDVIPIMAFADPEHSPPVTFLNHADHVFWAGATISDVVANTRDSGRRLSQERRGIPEKRCRLLPIPLVPAERTYSRPEAKRRIGVPDDAPVLLSIGAAYKYTPVGGPGFAEILASAIEKHERAVLLVVGAVNQGEWGDAIRRTQGRIRTLGWRHDIDIFYQAADIFVDSFPLCSETALLEAASYGVAPISYCCQPGQADILCTDTPSLETGLFRVPGLAEYMGVLSHLVEDDAFRSRLGERARQAVLHVHTGAGWCRFLHAVYHQAAIAGPAAMTRRQIDDLDGRSIGELDLWLDRLHTKGGFSRGIDASLQAHVRLLPFGSRTWLWSKLRERGCPRGWGLLLSPGLGKWVERRLRKPPSTFSVDAARFEAAISTIARESR